MSTILVTGGAGYVGGACCAQLIEQGHRVAVVDDLSAGHASAVPEEAPLYVVDIADRDAMRQVLASDRFDVIFHFAAKALIPESVSNPGAFFDANVASGIALLEAAREAGIKRFVFSSSAAVYGNSHSTRITEDDIKDPLNPYGETKLMLERALRWYASAYDWSVVVFRYFNACGATATLGEDHYPETHIIPLLLEVASGGREYFDIFGYDYQTPDGTALRDYVHILDIADAHIRALRALERPGISAFNIGTGTALSVRHVCRVVSQVMGKRVPTRDSDRRAGDPAVLCASPERLMKELAWRPRFSDIETIVRSAWEWKQTHPIGYRVRETELLLPPTQFVRR